MGTDTIQVEGVIADFEVDAIIQDITVTNEHEEWAAAWGMYVTCEAYSSRLDLYYACNHFPDLGCDDAIFVHEVEQPTDDNNIYVATFE